LVACDEKTQLFGDLILSERPAGPRAEYHRGRWKKPMTDIEIEGL
jgi:hypothetical protein